MNYHAADQLARQRRDQFAREASGDQLMAMARNADLTGTRDNAPVRRTLGVALGVSTKSHLKAISGLLARLLDVRRPSLDRRVIGPRQP